MNNHKQFYIVTFLLSFVISASLSIYLTVSFIAHAIFIFNSDLTLMQVIIDHFETKWFLYIICIDLYILMKILVPKVQDITK